MQRLCHFIQGTQASMDLCGSLEKGVLESIPLGYGGMTIY